MGIIFVKYNKERLPQFQTETAIHSGEKMFVTKKAVGVAARQHIQQICDNYYLLKNCFPDMKLTALKKTSDDELQFEYIEGKTLEEKLINAARKQKLQKFRDLIDEYIQHLELFKPSVQNLYCSGTEFKNLFGIDVTLENVKVTPIVNIDASFENLLYNDQGHLTLIDYEWIFQISVPIDYVIFRSVRVFYMKYEKELNGFLNEQELLLSLGIDSLKQDVFRTMENGFQDYVFGKTRPYFNEHQYLKHPQDLKEMASSIQLYDTQLKETINWARELENSLKHRDELIMDQNKRLQEISEWVLSLDEQIRDRDALILKQNEQIQEVSIWAKSLEQQLNSQGKNN